MFEPVRKPEANAPPSGRIIPALAALVRPGLMDDLQGACAELSDLAGLSSSEIVLRHGGGLVLVEQGVTGYDQVILTLAVERPGTAVIVISDQLPGHMVRALMKLEASDIVPTTAGIEEIIEIHLTNEERAALQKSAASVEELVGIIGV